MASTTTHHATIPVWLDCDPGHDDAFAILLSAYHPSLHLLGISTCFGNASLTRTTQNALSVLEAIGRPGIPVFPGASKPFCRESKAAPDIHGESGLDGTKLLPIPTRSALSHCNAILDMREALLACPPDTAWLVATGTLTNAALLFATFPAVASHIRGLSIMGGAIGNGFSSVSMGPSFKDAAGQERPRIGNVTPYAEFNIHCDPEAAQAIFSNPILNSKTVLIPLDLTHQAYATHSVQRKLLHGQRGHGTHTTRLRQMFHELLTFFEHTYAEVFGLTEGPPLHDPLAIAVILSNLCGESLVKFDDHGGERWKVEIELAAEELGRTKVTPASEGVIIPRSLDLHHFWDMINECLESADTALCFDQCW
jgi:uridine nucleosidase